MFSPKTLCAFSCICFHVALVQPSRDSSKENLSVEELASKFWQWRLKTSPEYGTKYGFHDRDDELEQLSPAAMRKTLKGAKGLLKEANLVETTSLSMKDHISLAVLKDSLSTYIDGFQYRYHGAYMAVSIFEHPIRDMETVIGWMPFTEETDFKRAIQRYKAFAVKIEQTKALLELAFEANMTAPSNKFDDIVQRYKNWSHHPTDNFLYKPFQNISSVVRNATRAKALTDEVIDVISKTVTPKIRSFGHFLENGYKSHLRSSPGVHALPNGKDFYAACVRWHLSLNITPQEVHDMGLKEVKRISGLMEKIKEEDGFNGTLRSYILKLKKEPKNLFESEEEMLETFKKYIKEVHPHLKKILDRVPNLPIRVGASPTPNSSNKYIEQSLDGSREGKFIANVWYPKTNVRFTKLALTLHEAEPGHHTQSSAAIEGNLPNFRRAIEFRKYRAVPFNWPFYTAYVEGWALYAESLGEEMDLFKGQYDLLGRYSSEIFRACRLVVDTGIHYMGWSFEDAVKYLQNYTAETDTKINLEVTRYIYYPGQATAYKIGELTIKRLRKEAEEELGELFDIRKFNSAILDLGPAPLTVVEGHIRTWIRSRQSPSVKAVSSSGHRSRYNIIILFSCALCVLANNRARH